MKERIVDSNSLSEDNEEIYLRPTTLKQYIGQKKAKENLDIFIKAAKRRNESLDHILLYGPPGLGKTTLANIIANELSVDIKHTTGPMIERSGDLAAILSSISPGDVLFIDEIHRLSKNIEEVLYSAMEDYCLDIIVGKDASARNMRIELPPFTLIGATTRIGDLSNPLRDRFGVQTHLEYYDKEELQKIILRTARVLSTKIDKKAAQELALRSRGTPRIANRLFKRIRDFSLILEDSEYITFNLTNKALKKLDIDKQGLDLIDHKILKNLCEKFNGGPVGIESLSATISEDPQTIEDVYEPFLLKEGFIARTRQGRVLTKKGYLHLGIDYKEDS